MDDDAEMRALVREVLECDGVRVREHSAGAGLMPLLFRVVPLLAMLRAALERAAHDAGCRWAAYG